jgi:hypothetical protein
MVYDAATSKWVRAVNPVANVFPDALLISHFDGPVPYNTDFTGNPNGHLGQQATFAGTGVIWRPGEFGKALQVAEATTNLVTNPSFETNTTGWSGAGGVTITRITTDGLYGSCCMSVAGSAGYAYQSTPITGLSAGQTYTVSAWTKKPANTGVVSLRLWYTDGAWADKGSLTLNLPTAAVTEWTRFVLTGVAPAGTTQCAAAIEWTTGAGSSITLYVDAVQVEQKAYATPYCDGSLGSGHTWSGTAHASTSSRAVASLSYPTSSNFLATVGTFSAWTKLAVASSASVGRLLACAPWQFYFEDDHVRLYDGAFSAPTVALGWGAETWHHVVVTWEPSLALVYVDGILYDSWAHTLVALTGTSIFAGSADATTGQLNGLIDDLLILPRALSATEVKALYDCGMPASPGAVSTRDEWQPAVRYSTNAQQSIGYGADARVNFEDKVYDNCGWVITGSNWRFTAQTPGIYHVDARITFAASTAWALGEAATFHIVINGTVNSPELSDNDYIASGATAQTKKLHGSADVWLNIGDTLQIGLYQLSGGSISLSEWGFHNWVNIHRIPS